MSEHATPFFEKEPALVAPNPTVEKCLTFVKDYQQDNSRNSLPFTGLLELLQKLVRLLNKISRKLLLDPISRDSTSTMPSNPMLLNEDQEEVDLDLECMKEERKTSKKTLLERIGTKGPKHQLQTT